ncbi:MAG: flavin reductase family protein [Mogibacterium sp.]|nr:flavin reductase family protein [Mogibacterium sp.]
MKKDLGVQQAVFPMPVLMVAAYDSDGKVNAMNVAWGQIAGVDKIYLCIGKGKKTLSNILESKAFTVSLATKEHMEEADFLGISSGNSMDDKFERTGLTTVKSDKVNAPVIEEFPVCMECEFLEELDDGNIHGVVGKIVNVKADETALNADGKLDVTKIDVIMFDNALHGYFSLGEQVGTAWNAGMELMK